MLYSHNNDEARGADNVVNRVDSIVVIISACHAGGRWPGFNSPSRQTWYRYVYIFCNCYTHVLYILFLNYVDK